MLGASEPWRASSSSSSPPSTFGSCAAATATEGLRSEASGRLRRDRCDSRHGIRPFATDAEKPFHASVETYRRQRSGLQAVAVGAGGGSISHLQFLWTKLPWMRNPPNADGSGKVRATLTRAASARDSTKPVVGDFSSQELEGRGEANSTETNRWVLWMSTTWFFLLGSFYPHTWRHKVRARVVRPKGVMVLAGT